MRPAISLFLLLIASSCNKPSAPAQFWGSYKTNLLKEHISNQWKEGGHRLLYWESKDKQALNTPDVMDFATKNGWIQVELSGPLSDVTQYTPRWIKEGSVYTFKTGFIKIDPETDEPVDVTGFVVLKDDGTAMEVYHLWGE